MLYYTTDRCTYHLETLSAALNEDNIFYSCYWSVSYTILQVRHTLHMSDRIVVASYQCFYILCDVFTQTEETVEYQAWVPGLPCVCVCVCVSSLRYAEETVECWAYNTM